MKKLGLVFCFLDIKSLIGRIYDLASRKTLLEVLYQGIQTLPPFLPCWTCRPLRQVMLARWKYVNSLILSKQAWVIFFFLRKIIFIECFFWQCPPALEERESLTSHNGTASTFTRGLLVDFHLEASTPDTFRAPPLPLPYDVVFGCPPSTDSESVGETVSGGSFETLATCEVVEDADCKTQASSLIASPRKSEVSQLNVLAASEEEDTCPICLEGVVYLVFYVL